MVNKLLQEDTGLIRFPNDELPLVIVLWNFTVFPAERPSFQVYEPLENSLQALDREISLLLQLLRG